MFFLFAVIVSLVVLWLLYQRRDNNASSGGDWLAIVVGVISVPMIIVILVVSGRSTSDTSSGNTAYETLLARTVGKWPDNWTASSMPVTVLKLKAGKMSEAFINKNLYGAIADPLCFVWSAPHGQQSVEFMSQVATKKPGRNTGWTTGPFHEGRHNFAECVYRGQLKDARIRVISTVDQEILVGWPVISRQGRGLRPGFNSYEIMKQYVK